MEIILVKLSMSTSSRQYVNGTRLNCKWISQYDNVTPLFPWPRSQFRLFSFLLRNRRHTGMRFRR